MFTGLIEQVGVISKRSGEKLTISPMQALTDPVIGESIAVNGCCLTLESVSKNGDLVFHTLEETLKRTNLAALPIGAKVNLERALEVGDRLGGHLVQGHVDATAKVNRFFQTPDGDMELEVALPEALADELVIKGSIAIDGVSLTICRKENSCFAVRLIPETLKNTALAERKNAAVNLESDIIGKYIHQFMLAKEQEKTGRPITMERLAEAGFL